MSDVSVSPFFPLSFPFSMALCSLHPNRISHSDDIRNSLSVCSTGMFKLLICIVFFSTFLVSFTVEGVPISIPAFNFDVATWDVGDCVDCSALSDAMHSFGCFPSSLLIREEMKAVWSIVLKGLIGGSQWVIVGSPGMGKSVLTVLLCFHIAKAYNIPVFLARQLKGEGGPQGGQVVLCIRPGGETEGYPKRREDRCDMKTISANFGRQFGGLVRIITVLDGWAQTELAGPMGAEFGGFDLLATSAQYSRKKQDTRRLVTMPAWKEGDLESLGVLHKLGHVDYKERLFYSGGSAREFLRTVEAIRERIDEAVLSITADNCEGLLAGYGASPGMGFDTLRSCYLSNNDEDSYTQASRWEFVVDSTYALRRLRTKAPLAVFERALLIAKSSGRAHYGWAFETLVHQLFFVKQAITLHVQRDDADEYESVSMGSDFSVECIGSNLQEAKDHLASRTIDISRSSYWHPDYPSFPVIDGIACVPANKTVWYIQLTVGEEKIVDFPELTAIHLLVQASLARSLDALDIACWKFKYVAIGPSFEDANRLNLKEKVTKRKLNCGTVGEVAISKGYLGKF